MGNWPREKVLDVQKELRGAAQSLGIDQIGFASADPFLTLKERLLEHRAKGRESGFEEPDIEKRVDPGLSLPNPRSIIAIAVAYPAKLEDPPRSEPGAYRGILSRSAWGVDYHHALRERLRKLEEWLAERLPGARMESMTDTGALSDRAVAERAGIGWSGKNCSIISPELGSWIYLGEMITDIPFEPDTPVTDQCGDCTACLDACPPGALVGPGQLNAQLCLSYVSQSKGFVEDWLKEKLGNRLYGCDTCQVVCPYNKGVNWTHHEELAPDPEVVKPLLKPILTMGNRAFKEKFGSSAAAWRGRKPIQRNAVIALGRFRDKSAVGDLAEMLRSDPRPELRGTAAWALGRIGGEEALSAVRDALAKEEDERVREDLQKAEARIVQEEANAI